MAVDRSRLPVVGPDPAFRFPTIATSTLSNGLVVRTIEHHSVPVVTFVLQVEGGSAADPAPLEGLGALTADMCDEGTGGLDAIEVSDALARIGAEYDVDAGSDATVFTLTTLARFAERGASLLADIVTRPSLREGDFERVRQLRLDRLSQIKDLPPAVAERAFLRLLYGSHPYGHLAIGSDAALRRMRLDDVAAFHAGNYRPERGTLVVAGAFPHRELVALAETAFGGWDAGGTGDNHAPPPDGNSSPVRLAIVPRDGAAQSELRIGQLSARRDTPDYPALVVMNAILGGQFVSRIMMKLREEKGFTYGARTGFDWRRGLAPFSLQTSVQTAATAEAITDSIEEIDALRDRRPPTAEEMSLARASLTRGYPRNFETVQQVARSVAQLSLYRLPDTYFEDFIPRINGVTPAAVTAAAQRYLDPKTLTTLIVGDLAAISPSLATAGFAEPRVLPPEM